MIFILWGEDKSCKNTLAFSFPKPLVDMEFDIGGFERACRNLPHLPIKDWVAQGFIRKEEFIIPFQVGDIDPITNIVRPSKIIKGMKELWYQFAGKFIEHLKDPKIQTIMVDTGTLLYDITCQGYLQELQEKQLPLGAGSMGRDGKTLRTSLQPQEYREPYIRMRGFIYQAKAHRKNLVITHHAYDEYGLVKQQDGRFKQDKTGKRVLHGWNQLGDGCDVLGKTEWDRKKGIPYFHVELAEVKELEGMSFINPTYDDIYSTIQMIRGE